MRRSYIWAALFGIVVTAWVASGHFFDLSSADQPAAGQEAATEAPFAVQVQTFEARERTAAVMVRGYTEASRRVAVSARTAGIIESSPLEQGDSVKAGEVLCQLDMAARKMRLAQAEAALASATRDYEAAKTLESKKFASESRMATEKARMDLAAAEREQIEQEIGWTTIAAPIDGVLVTKPAEAGGYLKVGDLCATLSVLDPILVVAQAGERDIAAIRLGMAASARLATGEEVTGKVRFIAPAADLATRTFRVELEIPNPERQLREGVTSELAVPLPPQKAHLLPPSALTLDDAGRFGVRIVDAASKARFMPVRVIAQERDGTWVTGLPQTATVITIGQDFVVDGQTVVSSFATAGAE